MKATYKKLPIIVGIILVIVVAVVGTIMIVQNNGHRVIKVDKVSGDASLEREAVKQEIYEGTNLKSQDAVITGRDGQVELLVDSDKHIWVQENTKFKVVSNGDENRGKLKIELQYGTSLVEIEEKLPAGAFFEVETPNATIGVRGTIFETSYYEEENKTVVVVTSGVVEVTSDTESVMVEAGQTGIVVDDDVELVTDNTDDTDDTDDTVEEDVEDENLPIFYSADGNAFELLYAISTDNTGIYVKNLKEYTVEIGTNVESPTFSLINGDILIAYQVHRKDMMSSVVGGIKESPVIIMYSLDTMVNQDGDTIVCLKYLIKEDNSLCYTYIKKISEDMYLNITVIEETSEQELKDTSIETYLPLTMNCYYNYSPELTLDTEMDLTIEPYYNE